MNRRKYDKEFKVEAVRLASEAGRSDSEVGRNLGIHASLIGRWRSGLRNDSQKVFPCKDRLRPKDAELARLRRDLVDAMEERDILKKALAVFSRRPK